MSNTSKYENVKAKAEEEISMSSTSTNFKFKIKNNLPQMTVEDDSQANMLKLIFDRYCSNLIISEVF